MKDLKIYNTSMLISGVFCAGALLFFASGIIAVEWWQWVITIAISGRYLYTGLSRTTSENVNIIRQHHNETAVIFCILLTISVIYSIGLEQNIKNTIINEKKTAQEKQ